MKIALIFLTLMGAALAAVPRTRTKRDDSLISWRDCGTTPNRPVTIHTLNLSPSPIVVPGEAKVTIHTEITRDIPNVNIEVLITKKTMFGDLVIPCINGMGSCTIRDVCHILNSRDDETSVQVAQMLKQGGVGHCPFKPTNFTLDNFDFEVPEMPSAVSFAFTGDYQFTLKVTEVTKEGVASEALCFTADVTLEKKKEVCEGWLCSFGRKRR